MLQSIRNFISYWYFRYLLVTELYMVEKWERTMFHIVLFIVLSVLYIFNTTIMLSLVKLLTSNLFHGGDTLQRDKLVPVMQNSEL
ncbi:unnamed protein product [Acanthoscelides obtectus]|uniref:Serine palmitoyltransferase small subunit A n=1 Tax=Acanthoscelides obtectus TaxID=200917 RepID=A0A9P0LWV6_ACAOB|nr:unnamed protein product [Acanthoscelides obtectus]CAK1625635.1 hypothetical protein AOBTE_LOCUS3291 [Acanthoscelides obtectus]